MEFIDLKAQYAALKNEIDQRIAIVLQHGRFIMGPEVAELEEKLAAYVGRKYCISCANGTDALQMVYMAYGIGAGDAVFCPDVTFIASIEPACMLGATPVFCDITANTYNICPQSLERQINAVIAEGKLRPAAVVAVDFLGNPADYDTLSAVCKKYNVLLIEDAAQSMGGQYHGKKCGALGDIATTSFFPAKPLGCYGDGGAIFTDDEKIAELLCSLRVHGKGPKGKYDNVRIGLNSRLDTLQAAILLAKLERLEQEIEMRQIAVQRYNEAFSNKFIVPFVGKGCVSAYAQYALLAKDDEERNAIIVKLRQNEIPYMVYYPKAQHLLPVFAGIQNYGETFANTLRYTAATFSLPMSAYVKADEQCACADLVIYGG